MTRKVQYSRHFPIIWNKVFQSEVTSSTLNMHYTLAHPENYGITQYPITYGEVTSEETMEASAILEKLENTILKIFEKKGFNDSNSR